MGSSYFIKVLLSKSYNFPTIAIDALADYFFKFTDDSVLSYDDERLPVLWHQTLLIYVWKYRDYFDEE